MRSDHKADQDLLACKDKQIYEAEIKNTKGEIKNVIFHKAIVKSQNLTLGIVGVIHDVTDLKFLEKTLLENEEKYRIIFENAPLGIIIYDINGIITDYNNYSLEILKTTQDNIKLININTLTNSEVSEAIKKSLSGEMSYFKGSYKLDSSNEEITYQAIFAPMYNSKKEINGGIAIFED